jgi:hypothetical protein
MSSGLARLRLHAQVGFGVGAALVLSAAAPARTHATGVLQASPYPPSSAIRGITWHWATLRTAAPGSDMWPVTWAQDGSLYTAWGDGGGFGGTNQDGRVSLGFARIDGSPEHFAAVNVNGGHRAEHPGSFPQKGKAEGLLAVGRALYAWVNMQDGEYPNVDVRLAWSGDAGATWHLSPWSFAKGAGNFKPTTFLNFGKGYTGLPFHLRGYVYFYGTRQGDPTHTYLWRAPQDRLRDRSAYEILADVVEGRPIWSRVADGVEGRPVFDGDGMVVSYLPALRRYLATSFHTGPGQLGVFDAPEPWGPWTTVAWYEDWGGMGAEGWGLRCSFPAKWMSADGRTLWSVFSVYGKGAQRGICAHDRFNLVMVTLDLADTRKP